MKITKLIDSKFNFFIILSLLFIFPLSAQAYFIGGMGAFLLEILAIVITFIIVYVRKKLKDRKELKEGKSVEVNGQSNDN